MITPQQVVELTTGGTCYIHMHEKPLLDADDRAQLAYVEAVTEVSGPAYQATWEDEFLAVDTSSGSVTVTLPPATRGREFQITKMTLANAVWIVPTAPDVILGSSIGAVLYNQYSSLRLKARPEGQWVAI